MRGDPFLQVLESLSDGLLAASLRLEMLHRVTFSARCRRKVPEDCDVDASNAPGRVRD